MALWNEYRQVVAALPSSCGQVSPDESAQIATLKRIAAKWREMFGRCVEQSVDSVTARRNDGLWEEWHAVYYGDGCTITSNHAYRAVHECPGCVPELSGCFSPTPPPFDHFVVHRRDIRDGWELYDVTPVTGEGNRAYCDRVGFTNRNSCPVRQEGWSDRLACEQVWMKGPGPLFKWSGEGHDGYLRADNAFAFEHRKESFGSLSVCLADGTVCQVIL
jgi:hypothetical protein